MPSRKNFPNRRKARREGAYARRLANVIALYGTRSWPKKVKAEMQALALHVRSELIFKGPMP